MKNKKIGVLALVLSLTILCGCTRLDIVSDNTIEGITETILNYFYPTRYVRNPTGITFDRIEYVRPDVDKLVEEANAVLDALEKGRGYFKVTALLDDAYADYYTFLTMTTIANIRSLHDLTDEYYAAEYQWCSEAVSQVGKLFDEIFYACAESRIAEELEAFYFWDGFRSDYDDRDESMYTDESVALMQEESALISEYRSIMAEPTLEWDGVEQSYDALFSSVSDDRLAELIYAYYEKYNEILGDLLIRLVDVRQREAEAMGFESYEQMQYETSYSRDYTPAEAAEYLEEIKQYLAPLYTELLENDEYSNEWSGIYYASDLRDDLDTVLSGIGGDVKEAMDFMFEYDMCDLAMSDKKASMCFETYLEDFSSPYLFVDPKGEPDDLLAAIHEMGHYTDSYVNFDALRGIDVCECFSMGLEYLSLDYLDLALDAELAGELRRETLLDAAATFATQASYAEFESLLYSVDADELTVDMIKEFSLKSAGDFGICTEELEDFYALSWIDITHFFEAPFYVITYTVSNDIALQFYAREQEKSGAGVELYYSVLSAEYSSLSDIVEASELESPFNTGRLARTEKLLRSELGY